MNLDNRRITAIIDRGYRDTVEHDCDASRCLVPGRQVAAPPPRTTTMAAEPRPAEPAERPVFRR